MMPLLYFLAVLFGALAVLVFGLAWVWRVPRGDDDDFKSGNRRFNP